MKLDHKNLVKGTHCVHIDRYTNEGCNEPVRPDGPNGWLCFEHDMMLNQPKVKYQPTTVQ